MGDEKQQSRAVPETADVLRHYIDARLDQKKRTETGRVISILLDGVEKEITFFCIKETEELIYYNTETGKYLLDGTQRVSGFCESVVRKANAKEHVHTNPINETEAHVRRNAWVSRTEFESEPPKYIPLGNGIFDLETKTLFPYSAEHRFLNTLSVEYNPDARCPRFDQFLTDVCVDSDGAPDDKMRRAIIQLFGYSLWRGYQMQHLFFLIGGGANGKGVLLGTLQAFLGNENVSNRGLASLSENRFAGADLYRKHANISNELTVEEIKNIDLLKSLVSGTDYITAEKKFEHPFNFTNYAKLVVATNAPPKTSDATDGFYRRLNLIRFSRQFFGEADKKDLLAALCAPGELSGILNLALAELDGWITAGQFSPYAEFANQMPINEMRVLYERLADSIAAFRYDALEITGEEDDIISKDNLFKAYRDYCKAKKIAASGEIRFWRDFRAQTLGTIFDKRVGKEKVRSLCGLKVKQSGEVPEWQHTDPVSHPMLSLITRERGEDMVIDGNTGTTMGNMAVKTLATQVRAPESSEAPKPSADVPNTSKKLITFLDVLFLKPAPEWVGQDGKKHGAYQKDEIISLPIMEAEWAIQAGFAVRAW